MKKNNIIITVLSILIIITFGILIFLITNKKEESFEVLIEETEISLNTKQIEVYDNVKLSEILIVNDNYILLDDYEIDTQKTGKIKLNISFKDLVNDKDKKGYLEIEIVDTTPPYIGIGDHYTHIKDTNFTFNKDVICKDNYDRITKCTIEGDYDIGQVGETNLKVIATDASNNTTEKEFVLRVIEKKDVKDTAPVYKKIEEIEVPNNASLMIDVSKWQEDIDWKQVKDAGIDYVMMRLGTQKAVDKESVLDTYFEKNIKGAQEAGLKVGVYYFSYANDIEDARVQAKWVVEQLENYNLDLPVSFDWECWQYFNEFEMNLHELNEAAREFLRIIEENGYIAINYGSKSYLEKIWNIDEYGVWLAHYNTKTTYSKDYLIWQFTDKGKVPGIKGQVDLDFYYNK